MPNLMRDTPVTRYSLLSRPSPFPAPETVARVQAPQPVAPPNRASLPATVRIPDTPQDIYPAVGTAEQLLIQHIQEQYGQKTGTSISYRESHPSISTRW